MNLTQAQTFLLFVLGLFLVGCSESTNSNEAKLNNTKTVIKLLQDVSWASVVDADGIKSIVSEQRIPSRGGFDVYDVDFKFNEESATSYNIYIGGMFEKVGTVVHVDVTDMNEETTNLYIRRTAQGHQVGYYRKR